MAKNYDDMSRSGLCKQCVFLTCLIVFEIPSAISWCCGTHLPVQARIDAKATFTATQAELEGGEG